MIGIFLGAELLGYCYTVAYRLGRLVLDMFTGVMGNVALATFARLQTDGQRLRQALYKITSMAGLVTFPIFTGLIVLAPDLIVALSGEQWLPSAPVMRILSLAGFPLSLMYFLAYLMISLGKPDRLFLLSLVVTGTTAVAFFISAPLGIVYVAWAYALVNSAFFIVYVAVAHRMLAFELRRYLVDGWRFFIPSVVMGLIVYFTNVFLVSMPVGLYIRVTARRGSGRFNLCYSYPCLFPYNFYGGTRSCSFHLAFWKKQPTSNQ
ncbi:MAG: oligosaccharide flippase family protein [Chloroflexi bacterium]|nr:oligosaccharide flippase family protein [Chloroflexota bacterium]